MTPPINSILFVCTGNICRSPTADGVMRQMLSTTHPYVVIDSAGTHGYHIGEAPDPRSVAHALTRGYDLSSLVARKVSRDDFHTFDVILAMDHGHYHALELLRPKGSKAHLALFLDYAGLGKRDVLDPYYKNDAAFQEVLELMETACKHIVTNRFTKA